MNLEGSKSKYETHVKAHLEQIKQWSQDGLTDKYKKDYPELNELLKKGKDKADYKVENALFKKATGYTYEEVTREEFENPDTGERELRIVKVVTKHVAPDVGAIVFFLKNRKPKHWKDNPHKVKFDKEILELRKKDIENKGW